jgi:hypothetical protein
VYSYSYKMLLLVGSMAVLNLPRQTGVGDVRTRVELVVLQCRARLPSRQAVPQSLQISNFPNLPHFLTSTIQRFIHLIIHEFPLPAWPPTTALLNLLSSLTQSHLNASATLTPGPKPMFIRLPSTLSSKHGIPGPLDTEIVGRVGRALRSWRQ